MFKYNLTHSSYNSGTFDLIKGMVHLTQDMASDDGFGPPE